MSLIMLLDKIQTKADLSEFVHIPDEEINRIVREAPEAVIDIIVMVMQALCMKLNLSNQDTEECVKKVRTRDMGYLWANMEKIDVQASEAEKNQAKAELADAKAELTDTKAKLTDTKAKLAAAEEQVQNAENIAQNAQAELAHLKALLASHGIEIPEN